MAARLQRRFSMLSRWRGAGSVTGRPRRSRQPQSRGSRCLAGGGVPECRRTSKAHLRKRQGPKLPVHLTTRARQLKRCGSTGHETRIFQGPSLDHSSSAEVSVSHVANSKVLHETPSSTGMYRQATVLRDAPFDEHGAGTSWVDGKPGVSRKVVAPCSVSGLPVRMIYEA